MPIPRTLLALALSAAMVTACGSGAADTAAESATGSSDGTTAGGDAVVTESPVEASAVLNDNADAVLLDIRTPEELAESRIPGATNIDFYAADFAEQIAELDRDATYVVYCRSGNRSGQSVSIFEDLGFTDVHMVDGGILAWADAGLPVEG